MLFFTMYSVYFLFFDQLAFLKNESNRTKSHDFIIQNDRYNYIVQNLMANKSNKSKTSVFYSPAFFRLSNEDFVVEPFWGFFESWKLGKDLVVLNISSNPKKTKAIPTNKEYLMWLNSLKEYDKYVNNINSTPSYIELPVNMEGVYIFKRIK